MPPGTKEGAVAVASRRKPTAGGARFRAGRKVRTEVLGAEHVARSRANETAFDAAFSVS